MAVSISLIAAACSNRGIGINGRLPWKLRSQSWRDSAGKLQDNMGSRRYSERRYSERRYANIVTC